MNKRINMKDKGITLIALVVTIIVILILAAISISLVLGNDGLITRAQLASKTWENTTIDEDTKMGQMENDIVSLTTGFVNMHGEQEETNNCAFLLAHGDHDFDFETGICRSCGYQCRHDEIDSFGSCGDSRCIKCGFICGHTRGFSNQRCLVCGATCEWIVDEADSEGWVKDGHGFVHDIGEVGRCVCGERICTHDGDGDRSCNWINSTQCKCIGCGTTMNHDFNNGCCIHCGSYED